MAKNREDWERERESHVEYFFYTYKRWRRWQLGGYACTNVCLSFWSYKANRIHLFPAQTVLHLFTMFQMAKSFWRERRESWLSPAIYANGSYYTEQWQTSRGVWIIYFQQMFSGAENCAKRFYSSDLLILSDNSLVSHPEGEREGSLTGTSEAAGASDRSNSYSYWL